MQNRQHHIILVKIVQKNKIFIRYLTLQKKPQVKNLVQKSVERKWRIYGKMKKLSVQGKKWNKRILEMKESNELLFREKEIRGREQENFDMIKKNILYCFDFKGLAENCYLNKEYDRCVELLGKVVDHLYEIFHLCQGGMQTDIVSKNTIENMKDGRVEIYIAYILGRFNEVANFLNHTCMDENFSCIEEEHLKNMYCAIKQMDKDAFIEALNSRIQDIRRIPLDYMVVLDYWAIALIKYAKGKGISVEAKYIEVGYIEEKDAYLFDY